MYFTFFSVTPLVQLVEHGFPKPNVEGSNPSRRVYEIGALKNILIEPLEKALLINIMILGTLFYV